MANKKGRGGVLFLSVLFLWLLLDAGQVRDAAAAALALCGRSVIPALFPFLVVSGLLVSQGFGEWAAPVFSGLMTPLFRLPGEAGGALALGLAGGYPVGARTAAELYRRGALTVDEAERLLAFCNNASPAYFISILGSGVFGSPRTGLWLYLIHLLTALLTGLLFRGRDGPSARRESSARREPSARQESPARQDPPACRESSARREPPACRESSARREPSARQEPPARREPPGQPPASGTPSFLSSLAEAVGGAAAAMVRLCGFVVFFSTLARPFRDLGGQTGMVCAGLLDLFSLTPLLRADRTTFVLVSALAGFGGLGVLGQTAAVLADSGLSLRPCVLGKMTQGVLALCVAAALAGVLL